MAIGQMHKTKSRLLQLFKGKIPGSYYDLVLSPSILAIDEAIKHSLNDATKTTEFNDFFDKRLRMDSEKKLKKFLEVPLEYYDTLTGFLNLLKSGHVSFILPSTPLTSIPSRKKITPVALPSGVQWKDITIEFSDRHNVKIKCMNKTFRRDYKDMGFEDSRAHKPNKQWELLYELAENREEISWGKYSLGKKDNIRRTEQDFGYEIEEDAYQNKGFSIIKISNKKRKENNCFLMPLKISSQ